MATGRDLCASSCWLADHPPGCPAVSNKWSPGQAGGGDGGLHHCFTAGRSAGKWDGGLRHEALVCLTIPHCDTAGLYLHKKGTKDCCLSL